MKEFKIKCPYVFNKMFPNTEMEDDDIRDSLVYEIFTISSDKTFIEFLEEIKDNIKMYETDLESKEKGLYGCCVSFLDGYSESKDRVYERLWKNNGELEPRDLLYPKRSANNRITKKESYSEFFILKTCLEITGYFITDLDEEQDRGNYGEFSFYISDGSSTLYSIRPCCPKCTTLLPDYWFDDEIVDYVPVALIGPSAGGKTTYMTSLMHSSFYDLLSGMGGFTFTISNAIDDESKVAIQKPRYNNLKLLEDGYFPDKTEDNKYPPVMFRMSRWDNSDKRNYIILSIFDSAGEIFQNNTLDSNKLNFLKNMHALIYFMEAAQIQKDDIGLEFCESDKFSGIDDPNKQGEFQKQKESKTALEIINNSKRKISAFKMLLTIINKVKADNVRGNPPKWKHISFTIIKCDELKKIDSKLSDELKKLVEPPELSFSPLKRDVIQGITGLIEPFINEFFSGETNERIGECKALGVDYSCHCTSVAEPLKTNDKRCKFNPIRIADPIVACLIDKFEELEWIKNEGQ